MSDFDSNPFADPDLNNPFKVSKGRGVSAPTEEPGPREVAPGSRQNVARLTC